MFSPSTLLLIMCCKTLLLFGDRGVVSSNSITGSATGSILHTFDISITQSGLIYAMTMCGLAVSAPTAAKLVQKFNALRVIAIGSSIFILGALGTALAPSFPVLLICRLLTGMGCGPFISLAAPIIDDTAPPPRRSLSLATLFVCLPVGFASGFVWGTLLTQYFGTWRAVFVVEAACMAPFSAIILCTATPNDIKRSPPSPHSSSHSSASSSAHPVVVENSERNREIKYDNDDNDSYNSFAHGVRSLTQRPSVVLSIAALAILNGALGCFSFWGSKSAAHLFHLSSSTADIVFGLSTVVTGVVGCLGGGLLLDKLGHSVRSALLLCIIGITSASLLLSLSFALSHTIGWFIPGFLLGELMMFQTSAPATAVLMWSVPSSVRPIALAVSEIANHVLGDVPLPPLLGYMQERTGNWRVTMLATTGILGVAAVLFIAANVALSHCEAGDGDVLEVVNVTIDGEEDGNEVEAPLLLRQVST